MLSQQIANLENENKALKDALEELKKKMEQGAVAKPKSCQYCKNYIQHYMKGGRPGDLAAYIPINYGHCFSGMPASKGGKKQPKPDDTCPFFELGTTKTLGL